MAWLAMRLKHYHRLIYCAHFLLHRQTLASLFINRRPFSLHLSP